MDRGREGVRRQAGLTSLIRPHPEGRNGVSKDAGTRSSRLRATMRARHIRLTHAVTMARNVRRLGHLDLAGAGQVTCRGQARLCRAHPEQGQSRHHDHRHRRSRATRAWSPRSRSTIRTSHSHKVRVVGDIMIVNHERNPTAIGRRADELPRRADASSPPRSGRAPTHAEIADLARRRARTTSRRSRQEAKRGYHNGGFKVYDVSNPAQPREIAHHKTGGIGVHRFDMDERYAYISTEMEGYVGNILVIYDMRDPAQPRGGLALVDPGAAHRRRRDADLARPPAPAASRAALRRRDVGELLARRLPHRRRLRHGEARTTKGGYNYHPLFPEPTHTAMPVPGLIDGRRIALAIDEEDQAQSADEEQMRRGRAHACILTFDVTDPGRHQAARPVPGERAGLARSRARPARASARISSASACRARSASPPGSAAACASSTSPIRSAPREIGWFIPEPCGGRPAPQTNDVALDDQGPGLHRRPLCRLRCAGIPGLRASHRRMT